MCLNPEVAATRGKHFASHFRAEKIPLPKQIFVVKTPASSLFVFFILSVFIISNIDYSCKSCFVLLVYFCLIEKIVVQCTKTEIEKWNTRLNTEVVTTSTLIFC